jgi:hypothetical protein
MKPKNVLYLFATIIILAFLLVACNKGQATTAPIDTPLTTSQEVGQPTAETSTVTSEPKGVPADISIMPNAYELQVSDQFNILYKVNGKIKDIVAFYQEEFPLNGWDQTNNPDSVVGSLATISRSKANGDRINISLQYNQIGDFTVVQIYITRGP